MSKSIDLSVNNFVITKWHSHSQFSRTASFPADEISKIKWNFLMLTTHIDLSIVSLKTFKKNQSKLTTTSSPWFLWCSKEGCISGYTILSKKWNVLEMKKFSKCSTKKFDVFTDNKYDIRIKWITKKVKHLLRLKSRNPHPSCMIYEGVWSYHKSYIGETVRNVEIRWQEHEDTQKYSEPAKILKNNPTHSFTWKVLLPASLIKSIRQNMKTSIVALKRPSLNPFMTEAVII